jgi:hypothetical protein
MPEQTTNVPNWTHLLKPKQVAAVRAELAKHEHWASATESEIGEIFAQGTGPDNALRVRLFELIRINEWRIKRGDVVRQAGINSLIFFYVEGVKDVFDSAHPFTSGGIEWLVTKRWVDNHWEDSEWEASKMELVMPALPPPSSVFAPGDLVHLKCEPVRLAMVISEKGGDNRYRCVWQKNGEPLEGMYSGAALQRIEPA